MKNLSNFLIGAIVMMCCFLLSCSEKENLMPGSEEMSTLKCKPIGSGAVFTVSPSADLKDSYAIQMAFNDAVAAGPGSTVQLAAGTFYLNERIEVEGFVGSFKGAGKDKTIITTPPDEPVNFSLPVADWESLIKFRHGDINISDFTIKISNPHPCTGLDPYWGGDDALPTVIMFTGNSVQNGATTDPVISFTLNNVRFNGLKYLDESGVRFNVWYCIMICIDGYDPANYIDLTGRKAKITNCEFKTLYNSICSIYNGITEIGGENNSSGNKFEDLNQGIFFYDCNNSVYSISNNSFTKIYWDAVGICQGIFGNPTSMSKFLIRNNYIEQEMNGDGILLLDLSVSIGEGKKMDVKISDNKIFLKNDIDGGGIWSCWAKDVLVTNNKIWGNGYAGIYSSTYDRTGGDGMSGWVIKGNNLQGLDAEVAPIWLNSTSHDNIVIGGSLKTTVLDEGTNNILIGVDKKREDHPHPKINKNYMRDHEMMKSFGGHHR
jgi:hypothetical protein